MTIQAVMFDFSGTLFRLEQNSSWLSELTTPDGAPLDVEAQTELMRRMTAPTGQVVELSAEYQYAWENRDLDPALHRKIYLEVLRKSDIADPRQAEALYDRLIDPAEWTPYPDTEAAIKDTAAKGVKVGVLSNIAFDIRPAFAMRGLTEFIDAFLLSFEEGFIKPQPQVFQLLMDKLGVAPENTLMVGDSEEADGGAKALGCEFALVDPLPTTERPDGLLTALRSYGVV
ncbi:HAD family hydrolase [Amycolatopsis endophytica]|uniref:HAD superfamily hydrolase (TIGR01509 family) n=1 Tax=Amycolatopsis endophytica TaxID=860233 RepID=A0A853B2Q0_9PSEU|nr:HAD family hydrolase [Amycolatopsis endophytica]NYI89084.1 HAD superfamily hydrolase (TIGR01509 family) [Amycolatopsis endophytica]